LKSIARIRSVCFYIAAGAAAASAQSITLSPLKGHPLSNVTVSGTGYPASVVVDLSFGTFKRSSVTSSPTGTFSTVLQIPSWAQPGNHTVSAMVAAGGTTAQGTFLVQTDWPELGGSTRGGRYNAYENTLSPSTVGSLGVQWSGALFGNPGLSSPAVVDGVVYLASDGGNVYALNANTGNKLWNFATGGGVYSSPAVANGIVYVGSNDHNVYALNASTGVKLWSFTTGNDVYSSPAVADGVVYVGSDDSNVYALNTNTGVKLWSFSTGKAVKSSPAVANGMVFVGSDDSNVYALNASTGAQLWNYNASLSDSPAVANGVVYAMGYSFSTGNYNVYAFALPR